MKKKFMVSRCALFMCAASMCASAAAQQYAGDDDKMVGDHLKFRTNGGGFKDGVAPDKCAPVNSKLTVVSEAGTGFIVRFYEVPKEKDFEERKQKWGITQWIESIGEPASEDEMVKALEKCKANRVNTFTAYSISKDELNKIDYRRTGVTFGALTVPFKYRLGGDRGIVASTTVAPYVGFRTGWFQSWSLSFTPLFSAGLGLVPVTDPATSKTETKSALSFATGFVMGSSKNEKFTSGMVVGRDLLSKSDRALDPNVDKWWLSFYVGIAL